MIAVIQRCTHARVMIGNRTLGEIQKGLVILLGVKQNDTDNDAEFLANKISNLRIFNDQNDRMNLSIQDVKGSALVVSQFTLCGDTRKGRRPSFMQAAFPDEGNRLYEYFMDKLELNEVNVKSGEFGAMMNVQLVNNGPVTFVLDSDDR